MPHTPAGRYIRIEGRCLTADEVRQKNSNNKVVDLAPLRSKDQKQWLMKLTLAALRISPRPTPVWQSASFLAGRAIVVVVVVRRRRRGRGCVRVSGVVRSPTNYGIPKVVVVVRSHECGEASIPHERPFRLATVASRRLAVHASSSLLSIQSILTFALLTLFLLSCLPSRPVPTSNPSLSLSLIHTQTVPIPPILLPSV